MSTDIIGKALVLRLPAGARAWCLLVAAIVPMTASIARHGQWPRQPHQNHAPHACPSASASADRLAFLAENRTSRFGAGAPPPPPIGAWAPPPPNVQACRLGLVRPRPRLMGPGRHHPQTAANGPGVAATGTAAISLRTSTSLQIRTLTERIGAEVTGLGPELDPDTVAAVREALNVHQGASVPGHPARRRGPAAVRPLHRGAGLKRS
jgi:hypothetical protein